MSDHERALSLLSAMEAKASAATERGVVFAKLEYQHRNERPGFQFRRFPSRARAIERARLSALRWLSEAEPSLSRGELIDAAERIARLDDMQVMHALVWRAYRAAHKPQSYYRGEMNPRRKLSSVQVSEIRERYLAGRESFARLGREYGVCKATVSAIVHGDTWRPRDRPIRIAEKLEGQ